MAELISAKDLPVTEAEEVDVLCVDNGELKRKQAKGLGGAGGYVIKVPASEITLDEDSGTATVNLSESYDNFADILYNGGSVVADLSAAMIELMGAPAGTLFFSSVLSWVFLEGVLSMTAFLDGATMIIDAANGTWIPPTE